MFLSARLPLDRDTSRTDSAFFLFAVLKGEPPFGIPLVCIRLSENPQRFRESVGRHGDEGNIFARAQRMTNAFHLLAH